MDTRPLFPSQVAWVRGYLLLCICPSTLCTHLSLFMSFMTPSSPLPAQQQGVSTFVFMLVSIQFMFIFVSLYILHDTFFTNTFITTGGKYSCFHACVHLLYVHIVSLYILHDTFFTTTCTTTACKYFCFFCMCPSTLCTHLSLFTFSMTHYSPLPAQQQNINTLVFMHVSIHFIYTFVSIYIIHDTFFTTTCTTTASKYSCFYACVHPLYVHICLSLHPP